MPTVYLQLTDREWDDLAHRVRAYREQRTEHLKDEFKQFLLGAAAVMIEERADTRRERIFMRAQLVFDFAEHTTPAKAPTPAMPVRQDGVWLHPLPPAAASVPLVHPGFYSTLNTLTPRRGGTDKALADETLTQAAQTRTRHSWAELPAATWRRLLDWLGK